MRNQDLLHVDVVTCIVTHARQFLCAPMVRTTFPTTFKMGLSTEEKKWKGNHISELLNHHTRISSFITAHVYGKTGCDAQHRSL